MPAVAASQEFDHGVVNQCFTPLDRSRTVGHHNHGFATAPAKSHRYLGGETQLGLFAHASPSSFCGSIVDQINGHARDRNWRFQISEKSGVNFGGIAGRELEPAVRAD